MGSDLLTSDSVPAYLKEHHADVIDKLFPSGSELTAKPILGGNVNYAVSESVYILCTKVPLVLACTYLRSRGIGDRRGR